MATVCFTEDQSATKLMFADHSAIFAENDAEAKDILHDVAQFAIWPGVWTIVRPCFHHQ